MKPAWKEDGRGCIRYTYSWTLDVVHAAHPAYEVHGCKVLPDIRLIFSRTEWAFHAIVNVSGWNSIPLVRSLFAEQNRGHYNRGALHLLSRAHFGQKFALKSIFSFAELNNMQSLNLNKSELFRAYNNLTLTPLHDLWWVNLISGIHAVFFTRDKVIFQLVLSLNFVLTLTSLKFCPL